MSERTKPQMMPSDGVPQLPKQAGRIRTLSMTTTPAFYCNKQKDDFVNVDKARDQIYANSVEAVGVGVQWQVTMAYKQAIFDVIAIPPCGLRIVS